LVVSRAVVVVGVIVVVGVVVEVVTLSVVVDRLEHEHLLIFNTDVLIESMTAST